MICNKEGEDEVVEILLQSLSVPFGGEQFVEQEELGQRRRIRVF